MFYDEMECSRSYRQIRQIMLPGSALWHYYLSFYEPLGNRNWDLMFFLDFDRRNICQNTAAALQGKDDLCGGFLDI